MSIIAYPGSKWKLAADIIKAMPPHKCYVEVFGGSAAVLLQKPHSSIEVYNDKDKNLYRLFSILRDPGLREQLIDRLHSTPYSREEFYHAHKILKYGKPPPHPIEHARLVYVIYNQSISGVGISEGHGRSWSYSFKNNRAKNYAARIGRLEKLAARLENVQIECTDWSDILSSYDGPQSLFYLDPPYPTDIRYSTLYTEEMFPHDHITLLKQLNEIKGMAIISGYAHTLYDRLEAEGWKAQTFDTRMYMSLNNTEKPKERTEVLWFNPACVERMPAQERMF